MNWNAIAVSMQGRGTKIKRGSAQLFARENDPYAVAVERVAEDEDLEGFIAVSEVDLVSIVSVDATFRINVTNI